MWYCVGEHTMAQCGLVRWATVVKTTRKQTYAIIALGSCLGVGVIKGH
jgi:hypothetical protein